MPLFVLLLLICLFVAGFVFCVFVVLFCYIDDPVANHTPIMPAYIYIHTVRQAVIHTDIHIDIDWYTYMHTYMLTHKHVTHMHSYTHTDNAHTYTHIKSGGQAGRGIHTYRTYRAGTYASTGTYRQSQR